MTTLPIEHAWMAMATGMHIHEHFLEVWPRTQERRGRVLYDRYRETIDPQAPSLEFLRDRFPDGFLEHCYRQPKPADLSQIGESLRFSHIAASVANAAVLLVAEDDCFTDVGGRRVVDLDRLPSSARRLDEGLQREASDLIEAAGLTYLVQLNVRVLVQRTGRSRTAPEPVHDHQGLLLGTCEIFPEDAPFACAENLLATAAAHWMYCFILARPDPNAVRPRMWDSPWSRQPADSIATAMQVFAHCIRLIFLERSLAQTEVAISDSWGCASRERIERERASLRQMQDFVYDLDASFAQADGGPLVTYNNLSIHNLLNTVYPGPRQFEKYQDGGGVGQYERG